MPTIRHLVLLAAVLGLVACGGSASGRGRHQAKQPDNQEQAARMQAEAEAKALEAEQREAAILERRRQDELRMRERLVVITVIPGNGYRWQDRIVNQREAEILIADLARRDRFAPLRIDIPAGPSLPELAPILTASQRAGLESVSLNTLHGDLTPAESDLAAPQSGDGTEH